MYPIWARKKNVLKSSKNAPKSSNYEAEHVDAALAAMRAVISRRATPHRCNIDGRSGVEM